MSLFKGPSEPIYAKDGSGRVAGERGDTWVIIDASELNHFPISDEAQARLKALDSAVRWPPYPGYYASGRR